jgi:hypothetical protein
MPPPPPVQTADAKPFRSPRQPLHERKQKRSSNEDRREFVVGDTVCVMPGVGRPGKHYHKAKLTATAPPKSTHDFCLEWADGYGSFLQVSASHLVAEEHIDVHKLLELEQHDDARQSQQDEEQDEDQDEEEAASKNMEKTHEKSKGKQQKKKYLANGYSTNSGWMMLGPPVCADDVLKYGDVATLKAELVAVEEDRKLLLAEKAQELKDLAGRKAAATKSLVTIQAAGEAFDLFTGYYHKVHDFLVGMEHDTIEIVKKRVDKHRTDHGNLNNLIIPSFVIKEYERLMCDGEGRCLATSELSNTALPTFIAWMRPTQCDQFFKECANAAAMQDKARHTAVEGPCEAAAPPTSPPTDKNANRRKAAAKVAAKKTETLEATSLKATIAAMQDAALKAAQLAEVKQLATESKHAAAVADLQKQAADAKHAAKMANLVSLQQLPAGTTPPPAADHDEKSSPDPVTPTDASQQLIGGNGIGPSGPVTPTDTAQQLIRGASESAGLCIKRESIEAVYPPKLYTDTLPEDKLKLEQAMLGIEADTIGGLTPKDVENCAGPDGWDVSNDVDNCAGGM